MAKFYPELNDRLIEFIQSQQVFFVATAPEQGRINLSPKGMDTLRCLDTRTVVYLDITGSGNQTGAHLHENGRITMMFCSFTETPMIMRLFGHGRVVQRQHEPEWTQLSAHFAPLPGIRQFIVLEINSVQTSCGFGVPLYDFKAERDTLHRDAEAKGEEKLAAYRRENNLVSIDGRPTGLLVD